MPDFLLTGGGAVGAGEFVSYLHVHNPEVLKLYILRPFDFLINCTIIPKTDVPET